MFLKRYEGDIDHFDRISNTQDIINRKLMFKSEKKNSNIKSWFSLGYASKITIMDVLQQYWKSWLEKFVEKIGWKEVVPR